MVGLLYMQLEVVVHSFCTVFMIMMHSGISGTQI